jgi:hypothetical protein
MSLRAPIDIKNCTIQIRDNTPTTPLKINVRLGNGNMTWSEKRPVEYIRDRGHLDTVRKGDEEPMEVRLDATWIFIKSDTVTTANSEPVTVTEALKGTGAASAWVSTSADPCEIYAVDLVLINNPNCTAFFGEKITFPDFRYENIEHDLKNGTLVITGKCNATEPIVSRSSNPITTT